MTAPVRKLDALTGLRFVAAALIVIHHSKGVLVLPADLWAGYGLSAAVSFFFVLSGFILTYVYPRLDTFADRGRFLLARFARLWPAHVCTFALVFLLFDGQERAYQIHPRTVGLLNLALLQSWVPRMGYFFSYNDVAWSISTEFGFYLLFLFLIPNWSRSWWYKLPLTFALAVGILIYANKPRFINPADPIRDVGIIGFYYVNPLVRLFEFALGMTTALVWLWLSPRLPTGEGRTAWRRWSLLCGATLLEVAVLVLAVWAVGKMPLLLWPHLVDLPRTGLPGAIWGCAISSVSLFFALVVLVLACERGLIARFLALRPMVLLGELSFTVYLLHKLLIRYCATRLSAFEGIPGKFVYLGFWIVLLLLSHLIWSCWERPLRQFLVGLWPKSDRPVPAAKPIRPRRSFAEVLLRPGRRFLVAELFLLAVFLWPVLYLFRHRVH
jgi:peptidoglycan/LPS O-acetylase OafA/YrhL